MIRVATMISLPRSLRDEVEAIAKLEDRTLAATIRVALREYLDRHRPEAGGD